MSPHFSWTQGWARLRPSLLKLVRRPVVWISGLGLLALAAFSLATNLAAPRSTPSALPGLSEQAPAPDLFGGMSLAVSITLKLALVLALIYGCLYLFRRLPSGWLAASKKRVALLETTRLSPRQALHLVRVGDRTLLVGATDQSVTLLTEITLPAEAEIVAIQPQAAPAAFTRALDEALSQSSLAPLTPKGNSPA
jgi:flagellar biosynthetic protein FliO